MSAVTSVTVSGALVVGMVLALLGSIKLTLARQLNLGEARVGGLLSAVNLVLIPMMLLSGLAFDRIGVRVVLIVGALVLAGSLFLMSLAPAYKRAFLALMGVGLGWAGLSTAVVALMPVALMRDPDATTAALNLGFVFIALGSLVTPVLADVLLRTLEYRRTVILLSFLCLVPAFLCIFPQFGQAVTDETRSLEHEYVRLWEGRYFWDLILAGLVFFFYAPLEGAVSIWSTTFLKEAGYNERRATWILSGFWGAFLLSRLLVALLLPATYPRLDLWLLIVVPALLCAVAAGNMAGADRPTGVRNGLLLLGFVMGPIFPTLVGVLFREFPADRGTVYGSMFALGSVGSLLLAPLIGVRMRNTNSRHGLRMSMMLGLFLTGMALVFALVVGTR
jgi:fucose permease